MASTPRLTISPAVMFQMINGSNICIYSGLNVSNEINVASVINTGSLINIANMVKLGYSETKVAVSSNTTFNLTFPVPETVFCDCTNGAVTLVLPDTSSLPSTATCKFMVRRINNNDNQIDLKSFASQARIYNATNTLFSISPSIGTSSTVMLCQNYYYHT